MRVFFFFFFIVIACVDARGVRESEVERGQGGRHSHKLTAAG